MQTPAQYGGSQCQGLSKQTLSCNDQECQGKLFNILKIIHNCNTFAIVHMFVFAIKIEC